ncbi:cytochrome P450 monooxygenase 59, partial [Cymbomonas tetramitiformis]
PNLNASQFYITTAKDLQSLDEKHTIFGQLAEGEDALMRINEAYCDEEGRPFQNIRIKHTVILDDPMDEPAGLGDLIPDLSPVFERDPEDTRLEDDWVPSEDNRPAEEVEKSLREAEAKSRAIMLEMIGDLPDADVKPPEEVLFVCRLNPVTSDEDLEIIFGRFGKITDCEVIRDFKTGESLQYAFIGFETKEQSEAAYLKMDNVLIDDRRIHVDFSQSVSKMWNRYKRVGAKDDASAAIIAGGEIRKRGQRGRGKGKGKGGRRFGDNAPIQLGGSRGLELKTGALGAAGGGYGYLADVRPPKPEPRDRPDRSARPKDDEEELRRPSHSDYHGREREHHRGHREHRDDPRDDPRDRRDAPRDESQGNHRGRRDDPHENRRGNDHDRRHDDRHDVQYRRDDRHRRDDRDHADRQGEDGRDRSEPSRKEKHKGNHDSHERGPKEKHRERHEKEERKEKDRKRRRSRSPERNDRDRRR